MSLSGSHSVLVTGMVLLSSDIMLYPRRVIRVLGWYLRIK